MHNSKTQFKKEFAKLMQQISIPSNLSDDEIVKRYSEIFSFIEANIPHKLFRFRKCNLDTVISFEQNTIPVCAASKFPDKYDSTVYYNHKAFEKKIKEARDQMRFFPKQLKENLSMYPPKQIPPKALEFIQSSKSEDEIFDSFWHEFELMLPALKDFVTRQEQWSRNNKATKIACFTESVNSKFMWDTYADGYKGFALEYDFTRWRSLSVNNHAVILCPIIYTCEKVDATDVIDRISVRNFVVNSQAPDSVKQFYTQLYPIDHLHSQKPYLYKDKAEYSHEKEWRLLYIAPETSPESQNDFSSIPDAGCLKAIYYGPEMEIRYKNHLRNIAKQKGLKEYDVVLDTHNKKYNLKLVKL